MKKTLILFFTIIGLTLSAQQEAPPQGINYQAVVYSDNGNNQPGLNNPGQVLWNQDITMRFAVYQGEDNPTLIYQEMHAITTDEFGMVSLVIGQGVPQGTQLFETINWGGGSHFLRVDVDKNAGINFESMSYQKLWSVPYALYSEESNSSNFSDSSDYASAAGNGITGVSDNGDGTLTFTYFDGSSYTTPVLSGMQGPQGEIGPDGPAGIDGQDGLSAYEVWISQGNTGTEADFLTGITGPQGPAGTNGVDGADGQDGLSAYEVWLSQGNTGTEADFLTGITGPEGPSGTNGVDGTDGQDGLSAYEVWLSQGNSGTEADFLTGITGPQGPSGTNGVDGTDGQDGLSAYEVWLSQGNTGTEADFLNGITGPQGPAGSNGADGQDGQSAYEIWLAQGNTGTEADFLNGITGPQGPAGSNGIDGADGLSAYEVWLSQGNTGTEADFLNGITGPQGPAGTNGQGGVTLAGTNVNITGNGTTGDPYVVNATDNIDDADNDPTNELQALSLLNDTLMLSGGNSVYVGGISIGDCTTGEQVLKTNGTKAVCSNITDNGISIGINNLNPDLNAALDVSSSTQGFLPPRLTSVQRNNITSPQVGLMIYNTDNNCMEWWNGTGWYNACNGSISASVESLNCQAANTVGGPLVQGQSTTVEYIELDYTGGNGQSYIGQTYSSTGVLGIDAVLSAGTLNTGTGTLILNLSGTPTTGGTATFTIEFGGQICNIDISVDYIPGLLTSLDCSTALLYGSVTESQPVGAGVYVQVPFTGGNGGQHSGQVISSTGVTGLTATSNAGLFVNGDDSLTYVITGTPFMSGIASFALNIGGQSCVLQITVDPFPWQAQNDVFPASNNIPCNQFYYDTIIIPFGVTQIKLEAWAGGGGGTDNQSNYVGQGGGGGAYAMKILTVQPGDSIVFEIGGGGCPNSNWYTNNSTNGRSTSIYLNGAQVVFAEGGKRSYINGSNRVAGARGITTSCSGGCDLSFRGGNGGTSNNNASKGGGGGGGAGSAGNAGSGGANGVSGVGGASSSNSYSGGNGGACASWSSGNPGQIRGGGGAGGGTGTASGHSGGQGGDGFVRISW